MFVGFLTAATLLLFFVSLAAVRRSRALKAGALCALLGFFAAKNLVLTILYLKDEAPEFNIVMFADVIVVAVMLAGMARR